MQKLLMRKYLLYEIFSNCLPGEKVFTQVLNKQKKCVSLSGVSQILEMFKNPVPLTLN